MQALTNFITRSRSTILSTCGCCILIFCYILTGDECGQQVLEFGVFLFCRLDSRQLLMTVQADNKRIATI